MLTLGLAGGLNTPSRNVFRFPWFFHDGAAVLVEDGEVIAAIEEERLNRIKHTTCFPVEAIRSCLDRRKIALKDVDRIAYYFEEEFIDTSIQAYHLQNPGIEFVPIRRRLNGLFREHFGAEVGDALRFVSHHGAHAASAFLPSGLERALVLVSDGMGDGVSLTAYDAGPEGTTLIGSQGPAQSLGLFYLAVIHFLGYVQFDEYKVMGLAPYGDARKYRSLFATFYSLLPDGRFTVKRERAVHALYSLIPPRRKGEPFTQLHKDIAASLQECLEEISLHYVRHLRAQTGHRNLCLAGGVAHNCSLNGRLLYAGLFDSIFVQPASHDAGCALGAALEIERLEKGARGPVARVPHVFWGTDVPDASVIARELARWGSNIVTERVDEVEAVAAQALTEGKVIGWAQGRSEFGPRALGHRSILADPRPSANKDRINQMVKKREGYRPFAPAIQEEAAGDFFELPTSKAALDFMTFVVKVRPEKRDLLGAITHVDGTARIQTVSRATNALFWALLEEYRRRTGIPILLNTSFNNNAEPIVDSVDDAVACFLTTGIDLLFVGPFRVAKGSTGDVALGELSVGMPPHVRLTCEKRIGADGTWETFRELHPVFGAAPMSVSEAAFQILSAADATRSLDELAAAIVDPAAKLDILEEMRELWAARLVTLRPLAATS